VVSTAPLNPEREPGQLSCLLVGKEAAGIGWGERWAGWGLRGNSSIELTLDGVVVPARDRLGAEGDHIWYVFNVAVLYILTAMAGTYLGLTASALEEARRHLLSRRHSHSGGALANNPVLQHRFGQLWAQVERTRSLLYRAAAMGDGAHPDALPVMFSAKAEVAECADRVVAEVMTLLGGVAYRNGAKAQRL
jgi:alkylation response protein AidB-like acyl-CoA dehydrogenase